MVVFRSSCLVSELRSSSYSVRLLEGVLFGRKNIPEQSTVLRDFPSEVALELLYMGRPSCKVNRQHLGRATGRTGTPVHGELAQQSVSTGADGWHEIREVL